MTPTKTDLYHEFVTRLLYADTLQAMRQSVDAIVDFDCVTANVAFDRVETDAERNGWTHTLELSRFVREQMADLLQSAAIPSEVTGPESLLAIAGATPTPIRLLGLLRRHHTMLTPELYERARSQAFATGRHPEPRIVLLMFMVARHLHHRSRIVESLLLWASLCRSAGDYDRAARHLRRAVNEAEPADAHSRFLALGAQAGLFRAMSRYAEAISAFEQCYSLAESDIQGLSIAEALADCCRDAGQAARAVDACTRGLQLAERVQIGDRVGRLLELRGLCHEDLGDYESGRLDYLRAAEIAEQAGDRQAQFTAMNNAAGSLLKRGLARDSYHAFREVLRTVERWGNPIMVASTYNNLGQALLELDHFPEAREQFGKSLALRLNLGHHESEIISFVGLGDAALGMEDHDAARMFYTGAIIPAIESGDPGSLLSVEMRLASIESDSSDDSRRDATESLRTTRDHARGQAAIVLDATATVQIAKLLEQSGEREAALRELDNLLDLIPDGDSVFVRPARIMRARLLTENAEGWQLGFAELRRLLAQLELRLDEARLDARRSEIIGETVMIHEAMLRALALPHAPEQIDDARTRAEFAFDLQEAAKSRSTLSALADAPILAPETVPTELRTSEQMQLRRERTLQDGPGSRGEVARLEELADVRARLKECWGAMRAMAPEYVRFRSAEPYTSREIFAWLDGQAGARIALVSLFSDEDGVVAFVLRQGEPQASMLRVPIGHEELRSTSRRLRRTFNGSPREFPPYPPIRSDAPYRRPLDFLAGISKAFDPMWDLVGEVDLVCVAPHGPLHLLPFHALATGGGFVAERFAVTYTPSLSVLLQLQTQPRRPPAPPRVLAVGVSSADDAHPEFFEGDDALFDGTPWLVSASVGVAGASKQRVLQQLRDCAVLHISCHGYFDERDPLQSGLVLSDGESKAPRDVSTLPFMRRHDFVLTAEELMRAEFAPRLVTLSACSAGLQHVRNRGDELDGFGRALLLAGASSAILGMWNLDQESSREFFRSFYRHLAGGLPKWRAFNAAQREMIASSRESWRHPYHWAPYYLIGEWGRL